ncbi:MAG: cytochrome c3 family protein [bacterium]
MRGTLRHLPALSIILILLPMIARGSATGAPPPQAADEITIQSQAWTAKKNENTKFSHKKHATELQIACTDCHHEYQNGNNVWKEGDPVQKCEACHTVIKTGKALKEAPPEEKKLSLYNAFHDNCTKCHKEEAKGPTKCQECHPKRKVGGGNGPGA